MTNILTINGGSSSVRFAVFAAAAPLRRTMAGKIERIGTEGAELTAARSGGTQQSVKVQSRDTQGAVDALAQWLAQQGADAAPDAIGHRIVHGMEHFDPELVTAKLMAELRNLIPYDPEHLPRELGLIEELQRRFPAIPQAVCFDTAFHRSMPAVAAMLTIPRRFAQQGLRRYGFHGLSYTYLLEELGRLDGDGAMRGRVILAHLGGGASMAAVRGGLCMDTSMSFTPASGLMMGTRTGDVDPGILCYLLQTGGMNAAQMTNMVNHESGLLGVSQISADVRDLLACESGDAGAREALALFCYQAKKWIGSFSAVLGGLDTLVFAGGIGENAPAVRERICAGLSYLGIELDTARNERNEARIGAASAPVTVRVIRTDEEMVIARATAGLLQLQS